jgi:CheY-like chemotaxis protein
MAGRAPENGSAVVLVVDDDEPVRRYMARGLANAGYRVLLAADGQEAWTLLETVGVDAVVTDVSMPCMDGLQLAAGVAKRWPTIAVLLVSGQNRPAECRGPFLPKPFAVAELVSAVSGLLEKRQEKSTEKV